MTASPVDPTTRTVPPLGGLNLTVLKIELKRVLRNRRTLFFSLLFPAGLYLAIAGQDGWNGPTGHGNLAAYLMVSMALYAAALTAAANGAGVATERAVGWSRQLRLTPLSPVVYIGMKAVVAVVMGAVAVTVVNLTGLIQGKPSMPADRWVACAVLGVLCTLVFAALGVFVGYLVPGENAMQVLGPGLAILAFLGNVFIPINDHASLIWHVAQWTPMFGVAEISRAPLTGELPWYSVVNALGWLTLFVLGAAWRMSRDTDRV